MPLHTNGVASGVAKHGPISLNTPKLATKIKLKKPSSSLEGFFHIRLDYFSKCGIINLSSMNIQVSKMSKDSVYYIRTGNKISQPFTINWFIKLLLLVFVLHTVYVTYEFFRIIELQKEIVSTEVSIVDKYNNIMLLEAETKALSEANVKYQKTIDLIEESNHVKPSH